MEKRPRLCSEFTSPGVRADFQERPVGQSRRMPARLAQQSDARRRDLLAGETEGLTRTTVQAPFSGDLMAVRLCVEHLLPVCRERPVKFKLPPIETTEFERRLQHLEGMLKAREAAQARGTGSTWPYNR